MILLSEESLILFSFQQFSQLSLSFQYKKYFLFLLVTIQILNSVHFF